MDGLKQSASELFSKEFLADYEQLCVEFDKLERESLFKGAQMELLTNKFLDKHAAHVRSVCKFNHQVRCLAKYGDNLDLIDRRRVNGKCVAWIDMLEDDLRVLHSKCVRKSSADIAIDQIDYASARREGKNKPRSNSITLSPASVNLLASACEPQELLADLFRRACEACYLRVTYNKARLRRDDDRREPVQLAQQAIRYDPNNFKACYFYMISK